MERELKFRGESTSAPEEEDVDLETEAKAEIVELSEANQKLQDRVNAARANMKARTETGYYFTACFKTKEDRDSYLNALGISENFFVDGYELADKTNIKITDSQPAFGKYRKDPRWMELI